MFQQKITVTNRKTVWKKHFFIYFFSKRQIDTKKRKQKIYIFFCQRGNFRVKCKMYKFYPYQKHTLKRANDSPNLFYMKMQQTCLHFILMNILVSFRKFLLKGFGCIIYKTVSKQESTFKKKKFSHLLSHFFSLFSKLVFKTRNEWWWLPVVCQHKELPWWLLSKSFSLFTDWWQGVEANNSWSWQRFFFHLCFLFLLSIISRILPPIFQLYYFVFLLYT